MGLTINRKAGERVYLFLNGVAVGSIKADSYSELMLTFPRDYKIVREEHLTAEQREEARRAKV